MEEISFTTTLDASLTPSITLSGSQAFNLASINLATGRVDKHSLTLLLQPNGIGSALEKIELNQIRADNDNIVVIE